MELYFLLRTILILGAGLILWVLLNGDDGDSNPGGGGRFT